MNEAFQLDYKKRGPRWVGTVNLPELSPNSRVLETGCGNGKTLSAIKNVNCIGIDISEEAVHLSGNDKAVCGDIRFLPFQNASFDYVFCWHVLGHFKEKDRYKVANELLRVVKPGGYIFFKGFSTRDFRYGNGEIQEPSSFLRGDGIMTHYFTKEEVIQLFGEGEIEEHSWELKVRGTSYCRSELLGTFHHLIH